MPARPQASTLPPLSVTQTAGRIGISRRRFYELVEAGKFPPPVYRLDNRKPFYPSELQEQCLRIKATGEALDGTLIMFNQPRQRFGHTPPRRSATRTALMAPAPAPSTASHGDLIGYLGEHGIVATADQVERAL